MRKLVLFFSVLILAVTNTVFAADYPKKDFLKQLHNLNDSSILCHNEGKYYVDVNKICVGSEGIFLVSDYFGSVGLSNLMCDSEGMYTIGMYDTWMCNGCGRYYTYQPSECSTCGGTSFTRIDNLED